MPASSSSGYYFWLCMFAMVSVVLCCACSQCLVRMSKACKLQLNDFYRKKKAEKHLWIEKQVKSTALNPYRQAPE